MFEHIQDRELRFLLDGFFGLLRSENTRKAYYSDMNPILASDTSWGSLNSPDKTKWRSYLATDKSPASKARAISSWKSFFKFCQNSGYKVESGILKIRPQKVTKRIFNPIEPTDMQESIESLKHKNLWIAQRNCALFCLLRATGMRIHEALSIDSWPGSSMIRVVGKGQKSRDIPISQLALDEIAKYRSLCPFDTSNHLFLTIRGTPLKYHDIYQATRNAAWGPGTHNIRRYTATQLLRKGLDLESLKTLLGHAHLSTTHTYLLVDPHYLQKKYIEAQSSISKKFNKYLKN